jgi:RNA polymerase sigma factor (sigma-70 family)
MDNNEQNILINNCLKGDRVAQKKLFDNYKDAMFTICLRITGDSDDAADALQDGFIAVFQSLNSFRGDSKIGAWIKTIIIRTAIKRLRKIHFESASEISDEPALFESDLSGQDLHNAILRLDKGFRTVFLLYEVEGYSHKEISKILKITEGTSKSQLHYAKKKLQLIIKKLYHYER